MNTSGTDEKLNFDDHERVKSALQQIEAAPEDACVVGSMSLSVRGLREHRDIDLCLSSDVTAETEALPNGIGVTDGRYTDLGVTDHELISNERYHDVIDDIKVVRPELSLAYKRHRNKPKDTDDIQLLEQYREQTDDWDSDILPTSCRSSLLSLVKRGVDSLRNDGIAVTALKTWGFLSRRYPGVAAVERLLPLENLRGISTAVRGTTEQFTPAELLARQYVGTEFGAMDIVVAYQLQSQATESVPTPDSDELEQLLGGDRPELAETALKEPVRTNHGFRVLNPWVAAAQLRTERQQHSVTVSVRRRSPRTETWLNEQALSQSARLTLDRTRMNLLEQTGTCFYAILWPPSREYHNAIQSSLDAKAEINVLRATELQIADLDTFVHDVYDAQNDQTSSENIRTKIEKMQPFEQTVRIVALEVPNPRIRNGISLNMEMMKNDIRHEFMPKFSDEYYYNILHVTDNYGDNIRTRAVLEAHGYSVTAIGQ